MTIREAAIRVLEEVGRPIHVKEITENIVSKKLWKTSGKTPEDSVSSTINDDIKKKGRNSLFFRDAPATFGLSKWKKVYSYGDSAEKVLERFGGKQPMHYREITDKAIEEGWLISKSLTPESSMYAQILTEIGRCGSRGEQSRFVKHGKGFVGLSKWMARGLAIEIENHNRKVRKELHKRLLKMDWKDFESLIAGLLTKMGFDEIEVTGKVKDGGIDVRGTLVVGDVIRTRMAVQVKRWKKGNVQTPIVQQVRGSLGPHEQGLIITTGDFSKGARENADKPEFKPVALMNGEQLVALLVENGIGVKLQSHDLIELYEDDLLGDG